MSDIIEIQNYNSIDPMMAKQVIERAVELGHPKNLLRWRVGYGQRHMIHLYLHTVADQSTCRRESSEGYPDFGTFCGIPYLMDDSLAPDVIVLDKVAVTVDLIRVSGLAIGAGHTDLRKDVL